MQKVLHMQMPDISLNALLTPVGEQTPMGLAWKFIGFSGLYGKFSGWVEVIPGVLFLFRRTTLIGALIAFVVMLNVVLLNYGYDIPVKIYSTFLAVLALVILSPNLSRIIKFLSGRHVEAIEYKPLFVKPVFKISRYVLKACLLVFIFWTEVYQSLEMSNEYGENAPKPPLFGIYQTQEFIRNGDTIPLYTDSTAWKNLVFSWPGMASLHKFSDKRARFYCNVDTINHKIKLSADEEFTDFSTFAYLKLDDSVYTFKGIYNKDTLEIKSKKIGRKHFNLYKTGFNWINEFPNNR